MHLTPEQFVDIAEGHRAESSFPHLAECGACRGELAALRAVMVEAGEVDVPEPSPLFFEHLSGAIHDRVENESHPRSWLPRWLPRRRVFVPLGAIVAAAVLTIAVLLPRLSLNTVKPADREAAASTATSDASIAEPSDAVDLDDPLLLLVADLSAGVDWDAAADAGFADPDSAEHAVTHMGAEELRALRKVLQQEMSRPGA